MAAAAAYAAAGYSTYVALAELPEGGGGVPPRALGGDLCAVRVPATRKSKLGGGSGCFSLLSLFTFGLVQNLKYT